jgi:EAL domain-containing protein (putative c-di-GMP-specific phosphodiesterase class I)
MRDKRLLVVDDDPDVAAFIAEVGTQGGYEVATASSRSEFEQAYQLLAPTLVICDLNMGTLDGVQVLRYLAAEQCRAPIVLISGLGADVRASAMRLGESRGLNMFATFQKPLRLADLERCLKEAGPDVPDISQEALVTALERGRLGLHYQPQIRLGGSRPGEVYGVEGLMRWHPEQGGTIAPARFIPVAEESDLIEALTDFAITEAARQTAAWQRQGLDLSIAVNLSPKLLRQRSLPEHMETLLASAGLKQDRLVLEVTESGAMTNTQLATEILTRLRIHGVHISLDDFGTGFSSMVQLYRMPFSQIKIDRSFVADLTKNREAEVIVRAIIGLAGNLGLHCCAEGIEDLETLRRLAELGCHTGQGYYISRPIPAQDLPSWLEDWNRRLRESPPF